MWTPQLQAAVLRALGLAAGAAALAFLSATLQNAPIKTALIMAAIAGLGALGIRGAIEGAYDSARARSGNVKPGDVGSGMQ